MKFLIDNLDLLRNSTIYWDDPRIYTTAWKKKLNEYNSDILDTYGLRNLEENDVQTDKVYESPHDKTN